MNDSTRSCRLARRIPSVLAPAARWWLMGVGVAVAVLLMSTEKAVAAETADPQPYVGKRLPVVGGPLLAYLHPDRSFIGTLREGETIRVDRLSPSGTWAHGFAYGDLNRRVWVRTSGLAAFSTASAAASRKAWHAYSIVRTDAPVIGGSGRHTARLTQMLLPSTFDVEKRGDGTYLAFGPVGSCRSTGSIRALLAHSAAGSASGVLDAQLPDATSYGSGTNGDAAWGIVNAGGGALLGMYIRPTRLRQTWIVVRVATTTHRGCHTGGYREALAFPLADALAATSASGY